MTTSAIELLHSFDALPHDDQVSVALEIARRLQQRSDTLSDDDLNAVADELFVALDQEEASNRRPIHV